MNNIRAYVLAGAQYSLDLTSIAKKHQNNVGYVLRLHPGDVHAIAGVGFDFYCTYFKEQAVRWATRFPTQGYVNIFSCRQTNNLLIKRCDTMTEEWLDFIVACRHGDSHDFDIVEGPMANDTIFNYIQDFMDGNISREAFWALAKFKRPTHQICFHTQKALDTLTFEGYEIYGN